MKAELATLNAVLDQLNLAADMICVEVGVRSDGAVPSHKEAFGVPWPSGPALPRDYAVINLWIGKLVRKLFPPGKQVAAEISTISSRLQLTEQEKFFRFIVNVRSFAQWRFAHTGKRRFSANSEPPKTILPAEDHESFIHASNVFRALLDYKVPQHIL